MLCLSAWHCQSQIYTYVFWRLSALDFRGVGHHCFSFSKVSPLVLRCINHKSSLQAPWTGAQTITVIMENHVLLWRRRPADWLLKPWGFAVQATVRQNGEQRNEGKMVDGSSSPSIFWTSLVIFISTHSFRHTLFPLPFTERISTLYSLITTREIHRLSQSVIINANFGP